MKIARWSFVGLVLAAVLPIAFASAARPELRCQLKDARIFIGESTVLEAEVTDVDDEPVVDFSEFTAFHVEKLGATSFHEMSLRGINGRFTQIDERGWRMAFKLTPKETGILRLPGLKVTAGGEEIQGVPLALRVDPPSQTDLAYVTQDVMELPKFPMQRLMLRVRVFLKRLPGEFAHLDPLQGAANLHLQCPFFDEPDGWRAEQSVREWLGPRVQDGFRNPIGFELNDYTAPGLNAVMFGRALFDLDGRAATAADVQGLPGLEDNEAHYFVYTLMRAFEPRRAGRFTLAAPALKGDVCARVRRNDPLRETIYVIGAPLEIVVPELPAEGRPAGFSGAIGRRFELAGVVAPTRCRVGDPVAYTLTLRGQGNLEQVDPPDFAHVPEFADRFAIETPTAEDGNGARIVRATLRPKQAGALEIPAIPFAYFDTEQGRYVQLEAKPVALEVEAVATLGAGAITKGAEAVGPQTAITRAAGAFADVDDPAKVVDQRFPKRAMLAYTAALPLAWAVVALVAARRRRHALDPQRQRRRVAAEQARARMQGAMVAMGVDARAATTSATADAAGTVGAVDAAREALAGLVAAAAGVPEAALATKDVRRSLEAAGVSLALIVRATEWFDRYDGARFGGATATQALVDAAAPLLEDLVRELLALGRISG